MKLNLNEVVFNHYHLTVSHRSPAKISTFRKINIPMPLHGYLLFHANPHGGMHCLHQFGKDSIFYVQPHCN